MKEENNTDKNIDNSTLELEKENIPSEDQDRLELEYLRLVNSRLKLFDKDEQRKKL